MREDGGKVAGRCRLQAGQAQARRRTMRVSDGGVRGLGAEGVSNEKLLF